MSALRGAVVDEARRWIGTPFRHQASLRGVGCDCLGLVRGIWRACIGPEPEDTPPYAVDWASHSAQDRLVDAALRNFPVVAPAEAAPGDILLFRWRRDAPASHLGLVSGAGLLIHAHDGACVAEVPLPDAWRRRIAFAFAFPETGERA